MAYEEDQYEATIENIKADAKAEGMAEANQNFQREQLNMFKLDTTQFLMDFRDYLKGETVFKDETGKVVKGKLFEAALNEEGQGIVMQIVSAHVNKNTFLSYLEPTMVTSICRRLNRELAVVLGINIQRYEVKNYHLLITLIVEMVFDARSRAIFGRENKLMSKNISHVEHQTSVQQQKGQGFFSKLKGMGNQGY